MSPPRGLLCHSSARRVSPFLFAQESRGFRTHRLSKPWGSCKPEEGPGLRDGRAGSWPNPADMSPRQCMCKALPRKTFLKVCAHLLSPGAGSWQGTEVPAGARSGARSWERHPVPRPCMPGSPQTSTTSLFPAPFPVHFQFPWERASGDTGVLQGLAPQQGWVHPFQPSPPPGSSHHLSSSSVTPLAPAWAGRGVPNPRLPLPPPAAASGLGIAWGDSLRARGQDISGMCRGRSGAGGKAAAPSITRLPWSTASQTANKHQILPPLPSKTSSQI